MAVRVNGDEATCFNPYFNGSDTSTKELEKDRYTYRVSILIFNGSSTSTFNFN